MDNLYRRAISESNSAFYVVFCNKKISRQFCLNTLYIHEVNHIIPSSVLAFLRFNFHVSIFLDIIIFIKLAIVLSNAMGEINLSNRREIDISIFYIYACYGMTDRPTEKIFIL